MSDDNTTQCLLFPGIFRKPVVAQFSQRDGSSDGGALRLKAADRRLGLLEELTACLEDCRQLARNSVQKVRRPGAAPECSTAST